MSVAVELGFKRYCQKCQLPFYDKLEEAVTCPHCSYSVPVAKYTQLKSSRVAMSVVEDEEDDDAVEEDIEDIEIDGRVDIEDITVIEKDENGEVLMVSGVTPGDEEGV